MRQKTLLLLLIVALSFGAACGWRLQKKLVGRWANKYATSAWDFKSDGTTQVVEKAPGGGDRTVATGSYKVVDSETIVLHWTTDSPSTQLHVNVKFNQAGDMILTLPDTSQRVFVRVD